MMVKRGWEGGGAEPQFEVPSMSKHLKRSPRSPLQWPVACPRVGVGEEGSRCYASTTCNDELKRGAGSGEPTP
eukprot:15475935-Alexandrium_andersonii.AAC.1